MGIGHEVAVSIDDESGALADLRLWLLGCFFLRLEAKEAVQKVLAEVIKGILAGVIEPEEILIAHISLGFNKDNGRNGLFGNPCEGLGSLQRIAAAGRGLFFLRKREREEGDTEKKENFF